ncbi:MAG: nucleotide exchange factor GrpE [Gammaproteobacteria bacterium]|nr:nucleotide exchange factor GrpE [Gammaproteobacteria bacterium]MCH9744825.1 nucleotide exchange factor GrpE [Gammaproteobacteria bacterium]
MSKKQSNKGKWEKFTEEQPGEDESILSEQDLEETKAEAAAGGLEYPSHEKLDETLTAVEMERDKLKDQLFRSKADLENLRRRSERDISNAHKYGSEKLLSDMLPVVDSIIRGLEGPESQDPQAQSMREGLKLTLDLLEKTLQKHGVVMIDPQVGEAFNPEKHEAMSMQQNPDAESNTILQVLQKGFELNGRIIRAAMVIVNQ